VHWGSGKHSICSDFAGQTELSRANGYTSVELLLVLSDRDQAERLAKEIPEEISTTTNVQWFPWEEPITLFCEKWQPELGALAWLSNHTDPNFQNIAEVLGVLYGAWVLCSGAVSAADVVARARCLSPMLIRPLVSDHEVSATLRDGFRESLVKIENFSYSIAKGFFSWEFSHPNGTSTRGIFQQDCLSEQFKKFQEWVVRRSPTTFDEIEEELL
jgi:hypothetical protein